MYYSPGPIIQAVIQKTIKWKWTLEENEFLASKNLLSYLTYYKTQVNTHMRCFSLWLSSPAHKYPHGSEDQ